jgi:tRNA dimethylallyltransferase
LGVELAERHSGEIVSADSVQVYTYLDIGSAKAAAEDRSRVRHHMIDVRYPDEDYTGGDYVREARAAIEGIVTRGKVPIVVGGTGLYVRLLIRGIADGPPPDEALRRALRKEERQSPGTLHRRLEEVDPETARRTHPRNTVRIVRALEVHHATGRPISRIQQGHRFGDAPYDTLYLCPTPERKLLYERIDKRVDVMIKDGLVEEVFNLYRLGYQRGLKPLQSLGYRHAGHIIASEMSVPDAIALLKKDTRHFAKRQLTWFRSEPEVIWSDPVDRDGISLMVAHFLGDR